MPPVQISNDQIKLFGSLFQGREDAYGLESKNGPVSIKEPLTDKEIQSHLEGKKRIGVYCLMNGSLVKWAVLDLDDLDKEKATRIYVACLDHNLFPYIERSKSKGFHIWIFYDEPVMAVAVRKVLLKILREAGVDCEIFPKQDSLTSNNGLGNFVYMPLFGGSVKDDRTVFLNAQFASYPDQWQFLSKIQRTKSENILTIAEKIQEESKEKRPDAGGSDSGLDLEKYLSHYRVSYKVKKEASRTFYLLNQCLFADSHTTKDNIGDSSIVQDETGKLTYQCFHGHCKGRTWADARLKISENDSLIQFCKGNQSVSQISLHKRGEGKSLTEILSQPETEENYLVKPILSRGDKGFIVSSYKMGKTLFLTQLTLCLSMGIPFLGFEIPHPAKVLYIRFELKESRFRKRLQSMVKGLGTIGNLKVEPIFELIRGFNINDKHDFEWLLSLIGKYNAEVLLLDPLYKIASVDLKDTANAMPLIRRFDSIIEAYPELLLITAHHLRKQTGDEKESWDTTYGPMFFFADMDFEIRIKAKHRENPEFTFEHISNDVPIDSFTFKRDPGTLLYYVVNVEADHGEEILEEVEKRTQTKTSLNDWMQTKLGLSRRQAKTVIDRMIHDGQLIGQPGKRNQVVLTLPEKELF